MFRAPFLDVTWTHFLPHSQDELSETDFELHRTSTTEEVSVGTVYGFSCLPAAGEIVMAYPDTPLGEPTVQVAYLDLQVSIWAYSPPSSDGTKRAETRTLIASTARVVLDKNKRPIRLGISQMGKDGKASVDVVKGTIGTENDKGGLYDEIELEEDEEDEDEDGDDLVIEDAFDRPKKKGTPKM